MRIYPLGLVNTESRRAVIVGGGKIATRKLKGILASDFQVTVISPHISIEMEEIFAQETQGKITLLHREYQAGDLAGAFLAIAATNVPEVNQRVWQEAIQRKCLVNVVDDPQKSGFINLAVVRRGGFTVAVSSGGENPGAAFRLRDKLEAYLDEEMSKSSDFSMESHEGNSTLTTTLEEGLTPAHRDQEHPA